MLNLRPSKEVAIKAGIQLTPQYTEMLRELQTGGGRIGFGSKLSAIQNRFGEYVLMYDSEPKISRALLMALMGIQGYKEYEAGMAAASPGEQQAAIDEMSKVDEEIAEELLAPFKLPETPEEEKAAQEAIDALPEEERAEMLQRGAFMYMFMFSSFFNTLSLMVHGAKLTSLVPRAIAGDDDDFLKAVQIDRMLLLQHPYFRDRKQKAQIDGEEGFLGKLSYRETNPPVQGKIRFPALYMLFGILDAYQWLDDLRHNEILDICDAAGLDRYQNRIEDVNYLTKRLIEYRRWQKV